MLLRKSIRRWLSPRRSLQILLVVLADSKTFIDKISPEILLKMFQLALLFLSMVVAPIALVALYRLTLHPLAGVPGPKIAAITIYWYSQQVKHGRIVQMGQTMHKKYGPIVRVGPNEIWVCSKEGFKAIYGTIALLCTDSS
jgi:hypothetical protein